MIDISAFLNKYNIHHHLNEDITIANVSDASAGIALTKRVLYEVVDQKTTLYLSGGRTPKTLYEELAQEELIKPGAVGIVDERFGKKFHGNSNEKMIRDTGLLRYLEILDIPYYPILQNETGRKETAEIYDEKVRHLNATFPQSVAILGLGVDGHTSSIAPNRKDFKNPMFEPDQNHLLVSEFKDPKSFYGERVGMTFLGLSMIDLNIVLIFGDDKQEALDAMFDDGKEEDIPARFYKRPDIAKKTLFITDQKV
jgi:6-phosphogluconolactonase